MALVRCEDCGREISDQATSCPQCGRPNAAMSTPSAFVAEATVTAPADATAASPAFAQTSTEGTTPTTATPVPQTGAAATQSLGSNAGWILVLLPVVGMIVAVATRAGGPLIWFTISAVVVYVEARRLGMNSARGGGSPVVWALGTLLMYAITVPWFLRRRRQLLNARLGGALPAFASIVLFALVVAGIATMDDVAKRGASEPGAAQGQLVRPADTTPVRAAQALQPEVGAGSIGATFDEERYCENISEVSGGSFVIKRECLRQERTSRERLSRMSIPGRVQTYCARIGRTAGGSYNLMETCVDQELSAACER